MYIAKFELDYGEKMMKQKNIKYILLVVIIFCLTSMTAHADSTFSDVPQTHWVYSYITELANYGIINGMGDGLYEPDLTLTKGQFIKLLTCALNDFNEEETYIPVFNDTPEETWYTPYVSCGVNSDIIDRSVSPPFYPETAVTRGEAAIWMINGLGVASETECGFSDVTDADQRRAVGEAQEQGLISGYEDGTFRPHNILTRAEAAALIKRLMSNSIVSHQLRDDATNEIIFINLAIKYP